MSYKSKRALNVLAAKSSIAAQSLGHPSSSAATAQPTQPASSLKASESLVQQPVLCPNSSGVLRPPTQPLRPPTAVAGASTEAPGCSGQILLPLVQYWTRSVGGSKPIIQQLVQPTSLNGRSDMFTLSPQPTASIVALQPVHTPTSLTGAAQPLICPSTIRFAPFQPSFTTTGSNPPYQPPSLVGTSQVNPLTTGSNRPC
ncbi:hypothetical protein Cgig2_023563 [Carnegiea gigantea]|uniref:Uncharacterized protein n=1 Tax=Carnegiea gigantea TaxID=171969 RepID=A0A9Q1JYU2_9CARY|nr:hypothetical protein Cgig2_023563 [Carnegiea gigantea]